MTKVIKWWMQIKYWTKIKGTVALGGIGTEITLFIADSSDLWKWVAAGATALSYLITIWIEDKNNNGIVDIFEKDKPED